MWTGSFLVGKGAGNRSASKPAISPTCRATRCTLSRDIAVATRVLIFAAHAHSSAFFNDVNREVCSGPDDLMKVPAIGSGTGSSSYPLPPLGPSAIGLGCLTAVVKEGQCKVFGSQFALTNSDDRDWLTQSTGSSVLDVTAGFVRARWPFPAHPAHDPAASDSQPFEGSRPDLPDGVAAAGR